MDKKAQPRKKVILDVDTGVDDALAIVYALLSPDLDVLGITTCFGNVDVETATRNTLAVVALCERQVPVYPGSARPLLRDWSGPVPWIHGDNGLGNAEVAQPTDGPASVEAAQFIRATVRKYPGEVTVIPVARMTNLARALLYDPELASLIDRVVMMGGAAFCPGNVTAVAEANVWGDPEAAQVVFQSGAAITMVGLDVTMQTRLTAADLAHLPMHRPYGPLLRDAVLFYMRAYEEHEGIEERWCPLHDPLAVAVAEDPSLCQVRPSHVSVAVTGSAVGMTVVDARKNAPEATTADVCVQVAADRFGERFRQRLGMAERS